MNTPPSGGSCHRRSGAWQHRWHHGFQRVSARPGKHAWRL